MSVYVANTKLYVTSTGAIGISGSPLAFNTGDIVPDATVTRDGLVAAGLVTSVAGTSPVSVYPVTLVQDPAGALSDGVVPEWDTTTSKWIPGTALSSTAANATYAPLAEVERVVQVPAPNGTNDTAVLATAQALAKLTGRLLVLQAGEYLTDYFGFEPGNAAETISWRGAGRNLTTIRKRTADGQPLMTINEDPATFYVSGFTFEGITFEGQPGDTPQVVQTNDIVRAQFRDCKFTGGLVGFHERGGIGVHFDDCSFDGNVDGYIPEAYTSFAGYPNLNALTNCEIINNTGWGIKFNGGRGLALVDCDVEGNGTNGVADSGGLWVGPDVGSEDGTTVLGVTCERTWFEANAGGTVVELNSGRNKFDACYFAANPNATNDVKINGGRFVLVDSDFDTNKTVSINEVSSTGPNYILNTDIAGGVTIDATKTYYDQGGWTSYTPTVGGSGWALGNGTVVGKYRQIGKLIHFWVQFTWGSTSTFGASASPTVDYPTAQGSLKTPLLFAEANDVGSNVYMLYPTGSSSSRTRVNAIGTNGASAAVTATFPFTWVSGDQLTVTGTYEPA